VESNQVSSTLPSPSFFSSLVWRSGPRRPLSLLFFFFPRREWPGREEENRRGAVSGPVVPASSFLRPL